jgi:AraC-like DNA-binding protein
MTSSLSVPRWLSCFTDRCHAATAAGAAVDPTAVIDGISHLLTEVPDDISPAEQLLVRSVLTQTLCRMIPLIDAGRQPDVVERLVAFGSATTSMWRAEWSRITAMYTATLSHQARMPGDLLGRRLQRVLEIIAQRYGDAALSLRGAAADVALSPWYIARMLKRHTGAGFAEHLRRHRLAVAKRLLAETILSVKEIAGAVGYHPSRLSHNFRATYGVSPLAYRAAVMGSHDGPYGSSVPEIATRHTAQRDRTIWQDMQIDLAGR